MVGLWHWAHISRVHFSWQQSLFVYVSFWTDSHVTGKNWMIMWCFGASCCTIHMGCLKTCNLKIILRYSYIWIANLGYFHKGTWFMGCSFVREEPSPKETPEGFRVSKKVSKATLDVAWCGRNSDVVWKRNLRTHTYTVCCIAFGLWGLYMGHHGTVK
jgi:hypothetical protein